MSILRMKGYCLSDTVLGILLQGSLPMCVSQHTTRLCKEMVGISAITAIDEKIIGR